MKTYIIQVLLSVDQLAGVLFWKGHDADETISTRLGRKVRDGRELNWFQSLLYRFLEWVDPGHCEQAIKHEIWKAKEYLRKHDV